MTEPDLNDVLYLPSPMPKFELCDQTRGLTTVYSSKISEDNGNIMPFVLYQKSGYILAKKNTKTGSNPVRQFTRIVDSQKNTTRGLSKARQKVDAKNYHLIINELKSNSYYRELIVGKDFFSLEDYVDSKQHASLLSKDKQFIWTSLIISLYENEINKFIELKSTFEASFINGDYKSSESILDNIEECSGISLWSINSRLELLQRNEGVESQKAYLEKIVSVEDIEAILAFFSNFFSIRNEENNTIESYKNEVDSVISLSNIGDYCLYQLLPFYNHKIKDTASILYFEERHSIVDRYIALISMMEIELSLCEKKSFDLVRKCLKPLDGIIDQKLDKIKYISSSETSLPNINDNIYKYDMYSAGNYNLDLDNCSENLDIISSCALFSEVALSKHTNSDCIFSEAVSVITALQSNKVSKKSSLNKLMMLSLRCAKTDLNNYISRHIYLIENNSSSSEPIYYNIFLELDNPKIINAINEMSLGKKKPHEEVLLERHPDSISLLLNSTQNKSYTSGANIIEKLEIPEYRKLIYLGKHELSHANFSSAEELFKKVEFNENSYLESSVRMNIVKTLTLENKILESIDIIIDHYLSNKNSIYSYDIEFYIKSSIQNHKNEAYRSISFCILMSIYSKQINPKSESNLSDIFENILDCYDVEYPSELIDYIDEIGVNKLTYLFKHVAVPRVLDDYTIFMDLNEIEEERIKICQILMDLDQDSVYSTEIKNLTKEAKVADLVNYMNNSKVNVNEEGVLNHIEDTLSRLFKKYQNILKDPELSFKVDKISERLKALALNSDLDEMIMHSSDRESSISFLCQYFLNELTLNPVYGLDTHISTSVRHGAFEGQVRRAFDEFELLVTDSGSKPIDRIPDRWRNDFKKYDESVIKVVSSSMDTFTKKVVSIIDKYLKSVLHIKKIDQDSKGLFNFNNFPIQDIRESIDTTTDYKDFTSLFINYFWKNVDESMTNIKTGIDSEIKSNLLRSVDHMHKKISNEIATSDLEVFSNCVNEAKTNFECYIDELKEWFTLPDNITLEDFSFDLAFMVALKQVNNCYVRSKVSVNSNVDSKIKLKGIYFNSVVEILFILLQNVIRHSGLKKNQAKINGIVSNNQLELTIKNKVGESVDLDLLKQSIPELNNKYSEESALVFANKEGGSGLSKIWRIIEHDIQTKNEFNFSVDEENNFVAKLTFKVEGLLYESMCDRR
ncbi:TPA: hypothetical protein ACPVZ2_001285 [Vibrio parahaemolyticus]